MRKKKLCNKILSAQNQARLLSVVEDTDVIRLEHKVVAGVVDIFPQTICLTSNTSGRVSFTSITTF